VSRMWRYEATAGPHTSLAATWPATSAIPRPNGKQMIIMFAHPRCPCTRATLHELLRIVSRARVSVKVYIVFYSPPNASAEWKGGELYELARSIPGAIVSTDVGGVESRRFQATTSGQTLLFSSNAQLLFTGGITAARGHDGDNDGEDALLSLISGGHSGQVEYPVYGCAIRDSGSK